MLSANANIYFRGAYVGKSFINTNITSDTLELSLGRDNDLIVERKKNSEFNKTITIGTSKKSNYAYQISVRNTKSSAVKLKLIDQIPITYEKDIEIEAIDYSNGNYQKETGKLQWELELPPGETKSFGFSYSVKYPKSKIIANL